MSDFSSPKIKSSGIGSSNDQKTLSESEIVRLSLGTANFENVLADLCSFASRQTRFQGQLLEDRTKLLQNLDTYFRSGLENGRKMVIAYETTSSKVNGYLIYKTTGEFNEQHLLDLQELGQLNMPSSLYDTMIKHQLPKSQRELLTNHRNSSQLNIDSLIPPDGSNKFRFSYYEREQDRTGNVGIFLLAEVEPAIRKRGIAPTLIRTALKDLCDTGSKFVVTFARCAELRDKIPDEAAALSGLQSYIKLRRESDGFHPDFGIRFHQKAGATAVCGIPNCAKDDESHGHMCFMIYKLDQIENLHSNL